MDPWVPPGITQLFLPAKGWQMSPPATAADSGNCRWPVAGRE